MNFSQIYFQKSLDDLTGDDLIRFFNSPQKETQYLEFKSSREKNVDKAFSNILKPGICAFLNSEGGLLIYGAPKEDKLNHDNPFHKELEPYEKGFFGDHDTIIRKISGGITPMPIGIRLKEVDFKGGSIAIFEIQQSKTKPHQTDNIYQIRIDGQKTPAPHYLIEALMKQVNFGDIRAYLNVKNYEYHDLKEENYRIDFDLVFVNSSHFINEKNIRFRLIVDGPMKIFNDRINPPTVEKQTDYFNIDNLSFGEPYLKRFSLNGKFSTLSTDTLVALNIVFHGEKSPSRLTVYEFEIISKSMRGHLKEGSPKIVIDNIYMSEHQKNIGLTHEESLRRILT